MIDEDIMSSLFSMAIGGIIFLILNSTAGFTFEKSLEICDDCHDNCWSEHLEWEKDCEHMYDGLKNICRKRFVNETKCHNECWEKFPCKKTTEGEVTWNE